MAEDIWDENLYKIFEKGFPTNDKTFIETPEEKIISYGELKKTSAMFANALTDLGVVQGDRVLVQANKSPEVVFLYLACLRAGAIFVPLNTAYTKSELEYFIKDSEPKVVVCDQLSPLMDFSSEIDFPDLKILTLDSSGNGSLMMLVEGQLVTFNTVNSGGAAIACILYTSGTTGRPKGAMLSHSNLGTNAYTLKESWGFMPDDVLLHTLPVFHAHGLFVAVNTVLANGTGMIFLPKFDVKEVIRLMPKSTLMMGVPTFYTRLLADPQFTTHIAKHMRLFISGSAPLLADTHAEFYKLTGHKILERYGMTETAMNTSNPLDGERVPGSVGPALPGIEIRVVDNDDKLLGLNETGDIQVRGPNVFNGYWKKPDKTSEEFCEDYFFRTGDIGYLDDKEYLFIVGRAKDLIISGGYNVYPKEIESCIDELEGIVESAVIGVPHNAYGEAVVALITCDDSKTKVLDEYIIRSLKKTLASYKIPKAVFTVQEIPRNVMGKVEKSNLRELYKDIFKV